MSAQTSDPKIDVTSPYTPRRPSPIVSISLNNPIGSALRKIKNFLTHKQTLFSTSFTIKVTPIVAMVSLFGIATLFGGGITTAYNFGKTVEQKFLATATPTPAPNAISPTPVVVSKAGTIQSTYQDPLTPTPTLIPSPTVILGSGATPGSDSASHKGTTFPEGSQPGMTIMPTPTPLVRPVLHYILVSKSGSINYLAGSSTISFAKYVGVRVLVTGTLKNTTLTVAKPEDIEVLQ